MNNEMDESHPRMGDTMQKAVLMRRVTDIKYSKLSNWRLFKQKFKVIDMFGSQINFTHKYKDTFKTMEGAVLTFLIYLALIVVGGLYVQNMVRRTERIINTNIEFKDLSKDADPFVFDSGTTIPDMFSFFNSDILNENFHFAFAFTRQDGSIIEPNDYRQFVKYEVVQRNESWELVSNTSSKLKKITSDSKL